MWIILFHIAFYGSILPYFYSLYVFLLLLYRILLYSNIRTSYTYNLMYKLYVFQTWWLDRYIHCDWSYLLWFTIHINIISIILIPSIVSTNYFSIQLQKYYRNLKSRPLIFLFSYISTLSSYSVMQTTLILNTAYLCSTDYIVNTRSRYILQSKIYKKLFIYFTYTPT